MLKDTLSTTRGRILSFGGKALGSFGMSFSKNLK